MATIKIEKTWTETVLMLGEMRNQVFEMDVKIGDLATITETLDGLLVLICDLHKEMKNSPSANLVSYHPRTKVILDFVTNTKTYLNNLYDEMIEYNTPLFENIFEFDRIED